MQVTDAFAATLTQADAVQTSSASGDIDRKDFLSLLVAQLQNQDPLNPMESSEFSSQLAQFSSLEQLMEINSGIGGLADQGGGSQIDALGLLGHDVRAASGSLEIAGGAASELSFDLLEGGSVEVEIERDGVSLGTFSLGTRGTGTHTLDLSELDGAPPLADGAYTVTVRSGAGDGTAEVVPTFTQGRVTGVDLNGGSPVLLLGGRRIEVSQVREVRDSLPVPDAESQTDPDEPAPAA